MPSTHDHGKHDHDDELHAKSEAGKPCRNEETLWNTVRHRRLQCGSVAAPILYKYKVQVWHIVSSKSQMLTNRGKCRQCRAVQGEKSPTETETASEAALIQVRFIGSFIPRAKSGLCLG